MVGHVSVKHYTSEHLRKFLLALEKVAQCFYLQYYKHWQN